MLEMRYLIEHMEYQLAYADVVSIFSFKLINSVPWVLRVSTVS